MLSLFITMRASTDGGGTISRSSGGKGVSMLAMIPASSFVCAMSDSAEIVLRLSMWESGGSSEGLSVRLLNVNGCSMCG